MTHYREAKNLVHKHSLTRRLRTLDALQLAVAKANGIAETDFLREYDGFFVNTQLKHAEETTRRYRVDATPVVFVAGKYQTDVGLAGGQTELTQLIDALAAHEKRR